LIPRAAILRLLRVLAQQTPFPLKFKGNLTLGLIWINRAQIVRSYNSSNHGRWQGVLISSAGSKPPLSK
jgi:hypothetical protein